MAIPARPWWSLWRGGLLALSVVLALSTQLLFQLNLYSYFLLGDILFGWFDNLFAQLIVGAIMFAAVALANAIPIHSDLGRHILLVAAIALGAFIGESVLILRVPPPADVSTTAVLLAQNPRWLVIGLLAYALFAYRRRAELASVLTHENELKSVQLDLQVTQARLLSAREYVEPHFLFNTLANLQRLYRTAPESGRAMLTNFIAYLRAALPRLQHERTTLGQDVELARAYLAILEVRMGSRLRFSFDIPESLLLLPFPPVALSTLVENAVKHGLNPLPEGGSISITARLIDEELRVEVADTGAGFRASKGIGSGLANLRARLAAQYGGAASLTLQSNDPNGVRATIRVPTAARFNEDPKAVLHEIAGNDSFPRPSRYWFRRIGQGAALGSIIGALDFLYYAPLLHAPIDAEVGLFLSSLILWSAECVLFALTLGAIESALRPRELHGGPLAMAALAAVATSVIAWHGFSIVVLRNQLGVDLFREHIAASGNWTGDMLYHAWLMLFFGGLFLAVRASHRWHARALAALRAAELRRVTSQQNLSEAKLKRIEACMDPSYLFQALARLEELYADNSPAADGLLDEIIAFLRRALKESRAFLHQETP